MGVLIGVNLPKKYKKSVIIGCGIAFGVTYVPLVMKYIRIVIRREAEK